MPKPTSFEIRDITSSGGYLKMCDEMVKEKPAEFYTYVSRLVCLQKQQKGYIPRPSPGEDKDTTKSHTIFFRTHSDKDITRLELGTVYPWLMNCEMLSKVKYLEYSPCFSAAIAVSTYTSFIVYATTLGPTSVTPTHLHDVSDDGIPGPARPAKKALDLFGCAPEPIPVLPVIANTRDGGIEVSFHKPKSGKKNGGSTSPDPVYVGVSVCPIKVCVGCYKQATAETSGVFKKCKRCWDGLAVSVWYCSTECQVNLAFS